MMKKILGLVLTFLIIAVTADDVEVKEGLGSDSFVNTVMGFYFTLDGSYNYMNIALTVLVLFAVSILVNSLTSKGRANSPPLVPYTIPFLGHAIDFGQRPIELLYNAYKTYGEIFKLKIMGKDFTFMVGPEAHKAFFESKEEELCARKAYGFTVPVFGKNVVYDSPPEDFDQQRKMTANGLTIKRFKLYVDLIRQEAEDYVDQHWGKEGTVDLLEELNFITVVTSTRTIQGPEVRARFNKEFSKLYMELDKALGAISFFFPHLPIPLHSRRDKAREAIGKLYADIIQRRKKNGEKEEDILQTFMDSSYPDGRPFTEEVVTGMCIALLLAGQHTSNVTSTWLGINLMQNPDYFKKVMDEQERINPFDQEFSLDYEKFKEMKYLNLAIKETLRLCPPIMAVFRKAEVDFPYKDYVIPKGSLVGVSPSVAMRLPEVFEKPDEFNPERFDDNITYPKYSFKLRSFGPFY